MTRARFLIGSLLLALAAVPPAAAGEAYLTLSENDCTRLARHHPAGEVAYRPGRAVRAQAVAPAHLVTRPRAAIGLLLPHAVGLHNTVSLFYRSALPATRPTFTYH